jgi:nucleotide-binding universal stress UspA family protein
VAVPDVTRLPATAGRTGSADDDGPVVVAFDGSTPARRAVSWAAAEAAASGRPLRLAHVVHWPLPELVELHLPAEALGVDAARRAAEELVGAAVTRCRELAPGVRVDGEVLTGDAVALLTDQAAGAGLLVLGASGQTASTRVLLGATAAELLRRVQVPVVVVRELPSRTGGRGRVVVGVDGSERCDRAIRFAVAAAARHGHGVVAVHAVCDLPLEVLGGDADVDEDELVDAARSALDRLLAGARRAHPGVPVRTRVVLDRPTGALLEAAPGAELLVVCRHGRTGAASSPLGSVSHAVAHYAPCPVAVV